MTSESERPTPPRSATRDVPVGDLTVRLYESGEAGAAGAPAAPAVLWLHGAGPGNDGATTWANVLPALPGRRHLAPDLAGFGGSTLPEPMPHGLAAITGARIAALIGLLDTLDLPVVDVVGHSLGGLAALALLADHPTRVRRAVLVAGGGVPLRTGPLLKPMITWYADGTAEAMRTWLVDTVADADATYAARTEERTEELTDGSARRVDLDDVVAARMPITAEPGIRAAHESTFARDGEPMAYNAEALAAIGHPVLILHGLQDEVLPPAYGHYLAEHLPHAELIELDSCGHWPHWEHPDAVARQVRRFLDS